MKKIPIEQAIALLKSAKALLIRDEGIATDVDIFDSEENVPHPSLEGFFLDLNVGDKNLMFYCGDNQEVEIDGDRMWLLETDEETTYELQLLTPMMLEAPEQLASSRAVRVSTQPA